MQFALDFAAATLDRAAANIDAGRPPLDTGMCPGVMSAVNPSRPMHLRLSCARYSWGLPGKGPAKHDGAKWVCGKQIMIA